ncbi:unnamed protein product [Orchesella dallaii]|uniref:Ig-like domain-containing protein n=1 Tax=Orchesella dallaii TaxID=48710 RepID=A0ABP1S2Z1_9HEXA
MTCGLRETSRYSRARGKMVPHRNYSFSQRLAILVIWSSVFITSVECFSPLWDSVKTQVFQEYEILESRGQISVVRVRLKNIKDHELIVGTNVKPNSRLILTCTAWYPSEWVYSGDADPTYSSNTTIENLALNGQVLPLDEMNGAKRYVATVVIGPRGVKQSDTGRYNCMTASPETGMKFKTLSAYFHLYVPGTIS